jgi:hypothetical protein
MKSQALLALALTLISASCANLQVFEPKPESSFTEEMNFAGYNSDAQMAWLVTQDDANLYIRFETESRISKMKILQAGFYVYYSLSGKKGRSNYIHFPVSKDKKVKADEETLELKNSRRKGQRFTTNELIAKLDPKGLWIHGDSSTTFHYKLDTSDFKIDIAEDSNTLMRYTLRIPFDKISSSKSELNNLVVGLVSGSFDTPSNARPMPASRSTSMGGTNMGGGNRMPTHQGTGSWQTGAYSELAEPIKIWFKIENIK